MMINKKNNSCNENLIKEFLMTNFLIIIVYEVIATPFIKYTINGWREFNSKAMIPFENNLKYFFSTIPGADENAVKVILSLIFT